MRHFMSSGRVEVHKIDHQVVEEKSADSFVVV